MRMMLSIVSRLSIHYLSFAIIGGQINMKIKCMLGEQLWIVDVDTDVIVNELKIKSMYLEVMGKYSKPKENEYFAKGVRNEEGKLIELVFTKTIVTDSIKYMVINPRKPFDYPKESI